MSGGPSRLRAAGRWLRQHYLQIDPRTAGLYRIVIGFLLCADALRHWSVARVYYSNDGILTNHWLLFKPPASHHFSLFSAFSTLEEVHVAFALSFACYFALMIGWHSRLFAVLSFVWVASQDSRLLLVENGGYVVVNLTALYACLLPVERRFSVDAWLRSLREHRERRIEHLAERTFARGRDEPVFTGVAMLATVNLAVVYLFNVINKSGTVWRRGDTVHYVLHLDRMITGLAVPIREHVPMALLRPLAWSVLSVEAMLMMLILSPRARRITRPLAMAGIAALHTSFGVMMRLGPFSWFMVGWSMILPTRTNWEALEERGRARARAATVRLDADSPLALAVGRVLARLDAYGLLRFEARSRSALPLLGPSRSSEELRSSDEPARFEARSRSAGSGATPVLEVRPDGDDGWLGGPAAAQAIGRALPFGALWWRPATWISLGLLPRLPALLERHRGRLERWLWPAGMARADAAPAEPPPPSPLRLRLARTGGRLRELLVVWLTACFVIQAFHENKAIPPFLKPPQPDIMRATTHLFRTLQGWGMFSPNPIQEDGVLTVDAFTVDGRRIDPLTGEPPVLDLVPVKGMGLGQIEQDYGNRIRSDRNDVYRKGLEDFLQGWHHVTGRPEDEIVAYDVYWVTEKCPPPGEVTPSEGKRFAIRSWRKPRWRPPPGYPATIPSPPRIESAGN